MKLKIFGTVKKLAYDLNAKVWSISIVPTNTYAIKGTNEKKTYALLRPNEDIGQIVSFEYNDVVIVEGNAIAELSPVLSIGQIIGFIMSDLSVDDTSTQSDKELLKIKMSGQSTEYVLLECVIS